ncbi:MAG: hypothetical protein QOI11_3856 [Candidatus Eremiobacteraeota bacterium]|jgi:hypothetical protein|nr:hypothetical protein [Candidatus Eremiobacteraeota bacterium]
MAEGPQRKLSARSATAKRTSNPEPTRFRQIGKSSAQIVRDAALLLDEELAAGIITAKQVEQRFRTERRIDPADFQGALQRFRDNGHEIISILDEQLAALRSEENADVVKRLIESTHAILDVAVEAITIGAEVAGQLSASDAPGKTPAARKRRSR